MKKKKKKTKVTNRNGLAKALESPTHRHRVIPDKRKKKKRIVDLSDLDDDNWITSILNF